MIQPAVKVNTAKKERQGDFEAAAGGVYILRTRCVQRLYAHVTRPRAGCQVRSSYPYCSVRNSLLPTRFCSETADRAAPNTEACSSTMEAPEATST